MTTRPTITITISGAQGTGKTAVARLIGWMLYPLGCDVVIDDADDEPEEDKKQMQRVREDSLRSATIIIRTTH